MSRIYEAIQRAAEKLDAERSDEDVALGSVLAPKTCSGTDAKAERTPSMPLSSQPHSRQFLAYQEHPGSTSGAHAQNEYRTLVVTLQEQARLAFQTDAHPLAAEQFRMLRHALSERFTKGGVLMLTSAAPRDGKTITTVNLCACLAERGESTLLLELDVRQPAIDKALHCVRTGAGIEDALAGKALVGDAVQFVKPLSFHAALVTKIPSDPCSIITKTNVERVIRWARGNFKWVIIDAPPALPASDVSEMLPTTDGALLVVRARSTPRELAKRTATLLGDRLLGAILNDAPAEASPYYGYLSAYQNQYGAKRVMTTSSQPAAPARA